MGNRIQLEGRLGRREAEGKGLRNPVLGPSQPQAHMRPTVPSNWRELEQIQFLLGHVSVQTTERYLGGKQRFRNAVNDRIVLEPDLAGSQLIPPAGRLAGEIL